MILFNYSGSVDLWRSPRPRPIADFSYLCHGTPRAPILYMSEAAKKHDAQYAAFAARMLAALAAEEADIARINAPFAEPTAAQSLETVRPTK